MVGQPIWSLNHAPRAQATTVVTAETHGELTKFSVQTGLISYRDVRLHTSAQACEKRHPRLRLHQSIGAVPEVGSSNAIARESKVCPPLA